MDTEWICTDGGIQWVKPLGNREFYLIEIREMPEGDYEIVTGIFNVAEYDDEADNLLRSYGYKGITDVIEQYGDESDQIIAECAFEQTSDMELTTFRAKTEEEALAVAEEYMKVN